MTDERQTAVTWITAEECAKRLGVSLRTVYRYAKTGEIPATKLVGKWVVPEHGLDDYLYHKSMANMDRHLVESGAGGQLG